MDNKLDDEQVIQYFDRIAEEFDSIYDNKGSKLDKFINKFFRKGLYERVTLAMRELSDIEDMRKSNKVQYGKVAAAIGKFRDELGLTVDLPDINIARFGFTPNLDNNSIVFDLI